MIKQLLGTDIQATALISPDLPLRVNLTSLENIALIAQLHQHTSWADASQRAQQLLHAMCSDDIALKRDEDLSYMQRFVVKTARAIMLKRPLILIDRPACLLPDVFYPEVLSRILNGVHDEIPHYTIVDYHWNRPLYEHTK
jgi:ABC-type lipoprotein export system ATPase subunit